MLCQPVAGPLGSVQQLGHAPAIGLLARAEHHAQWVAQGVPDGVDFGRPSAAAAAGSFVADAAFFRLPAACAWARTRVEVRMTQSKPDSCTASNKGYQIPFWAPRQLRLRSVSCWPKRAGSAR